MHDETKERKKRSRIKSNKSMLLNISSVVEFQTWSVLKSKIFAQESTCSKEKNAADEFWVQIPMFEL